MNEKEVELPSTKDGTEEISDRLYAFKKVDICRKAEHLREHELSLRS